MSSKAPGGPIPLTLDERVGVLEKRMERVFEAMERLTDNMAMMLGVAVQTQPGAMDTKVAVDSKSVWEKNEEEAYKIFISEFEPVEKSKVEKYLRADDVTSLLQVITRVLYNLKRIPESLTSLDHHYHCGCMACYIIYSITGPNCTWNGPQFRSRIVPEFKGDPNQPFLNRGRPHDPLRNEPPNYRYPFGLTKEELDVVLGILPFDLIYWESGSTGSNEEKHRKWHQSGDEWTFDMDNRYIKAKRIDQMLHKIAAEKSRVHLVPKPQL